MPGSDLRGSKRSYQYVSTLPEETRPGDLTPNSWRSSFTVALLLISPTEIGGAGKAAREVFIFGGMRVRAIVSCTGTGDVFWRLRALFSSSLVFRRRFSFCNLISIRLTARRETNLNGTEVNILGGHPRLIACSPLRLELVYSREYTLLSFVNQSPMV